MQIYSNFSFFHMIGYFVFISKQILFECRHGLFLHSIAPGKSGKYTTTTTTTNYMYLICRVVGFKLCDRLKTINVINCTMPFLMHTISSGLIHLKQRISLPSTTPILGTFFIYFCTSLSSRSSSSTLNWVIFYSAVILELLGLVWLIPGYLRQTWGSIGKILVAISWVIEIISYPRKLFWGTVVILNLGIQNKQCTKIAGKFWAGKYPRNIVWYFLD